MACVLEAKNISLGGGKNRVPLFQNLNFVWRAPSFQVLMGKSGSGKSSLLKCLGGVWRADTGSVSLDGTPLWREYPSEANEVVLKRMGFAFQSNALFSSKRVLENLLYPHRKHFPEISEKERRDIGFLWLKKVGLEASASLYPDELSGGMQKRLAIARALILEPDCLFLDDPTAGLDPITSRQIATLLNSLLKDQRGLVVLVTNEGNRARDWNEKIHILENQKLYSPGQESYEVLKRKYLFS